METELKETKNVSNKIDDVDEVEETYKGVDELDELDDEIQNEIDVYSFKNKEVIGDYKEGGFYYVKHNFGTNTTCGQQ